MREITTCLNAIGNNLTEIGNVLVQEREEKFVYHSILQKARGMGSSVSEQGAALTRSTDTYPMPGNRRKR